MNRINKIIKHTLYLEFIDKIKTYEKNRVFCKHDPVHFMDVCRLAEIDWLKYRLGESEEYTQGANSENEPERVLINKEMLYACGLLHDIGRWQEYENGIRHEIASAELAPGILKDCGFDEYEIKEIVLAIRNHRNKEISDEVSLSGFLYRADKKSRPCYLCEAERECDWSPGKKNLEIR